MTNNFKPIAEKTRIGHVHMKASDLKKIKSFYVGILGFNITHEFDHAIFLAAGDYHHHLAFNTWHTKDQGPANVKTTGLYHIAILYPTRKDLADALKRLKDNNWPIGGASDHGTHEAIYLQDPEGNGLELAWDREMSDWPKNEETFAQITRLNLANLLSELD